MHYYVVYWDVEGELAMNQFDTEVLLCAFIDRKLKSDSTYELSDFTVIHGYPLNIRQRFVKETYLDDKS